MPDHTLEQDIPGIAGQVLLCTRVMEPGCVHRTQTHTTGAKKASFFATAQITLSTIARRARTTGNICWHSRVRRMST